MISLSFDDALDEHLDFAWPTLRRYGLTATFYANLNSVALTKRLREWQELAEAGNELGNHTIFHPAVSSKKWVREGNAIELYTPDRMRMELEVANQWLTAIDGRIQRTFAYPCSNTILGGDGWIRRCLGRVGMKNRLPDRIVKRWNIDFGSKQFAYNSVALESAFACRGGGLSLRETSPPITQLTRDYLPSAAVENHTSQEMQAFISRSLNAGNWPILQFHGVGGGHRLDCAKSEFTTLVEWLAHNHKSSVVTVLSGAQRLFP